MIGVPESRGLWYPIFLPSHQTQKKQENEFPCSKKPADR